MAGFNQLVSGFAQGIPVGTGYGASYLEGRRARAYRQAGALYDEAMTGATPTGTGIGSAAVGGEPPAPVGLEGRPSPTSPPLPADVEGPDVPGPDLYLGPDLDIDVDSVPDYRDLAERMSQKVMKAGDFPGAIEMRQQVLDVSRSTASSYMKEFVRRHDTGDYVGAAKALRAANAYLPNGIGANVHARSDGTIMVQGTDSTGKPFGKPKPVTVEMVNDWLVQMENPEAFAGLTYNRDRLERDTYFRQRQLEQDQRILEFNIWTEDNRNKRFIAGLYDDYYRAVSGFVGKEFEGPNTPDVSAKDTQSLARGVSGFLDQRIRTLTALRESQQNDDGGYVGAAEGLEPGVTSNISLSDRILDSYYNYDLAKPVGWLAPQIMAATGVAEPSFSAFSAENAALQLLYGAKGEGGIAADPELLDSYRNDRITGHVVPDKKGRVLIEWRLDGKPMEGYLYDTGITVGALQNDSAPKNADDIARRAEWARKNWKIPHYVPQTPGYGRPNIGGFSGASAPPAPPQALPGAAPVPPGAAGGPAGPSGGPAAAPAPAGGSPPPMGGALPPQVGPVQAPTDSEAPPPLPYVGRGGIDTPLIDLSKLGQPDAQPINMEAINTGRIRMDLPASTGTERPSVRGDTSPIPPPGEAGYTGRELENLSPAEQAIASQFQNMYREETGRNPSMEETLRYVESAVRARSQATSLPRDIRRAILDWNSQHGGSAFNPQGRTANRGRLNYGVPTQ